MSADSAGKLVSSAFEVPLNSSMFTWTVYISILVVLAGTILMHRNSNADMIDSLEREVNLPIPVQPGPPFPLVTEYCDIVCGFGRGSAELGIPTANVPIGQLPKQMNDLDLGVYFGFAHIKPAEHREPSVETRQDGRTVVYNYGQYLSEVNGDLDVLPMVLSVGKNPFYGNDFKTMELHVLHDFKNDFYGAKVKFNILGHIRPELNYTTKEALIKDINIDIRTAQSVLVTSPYQTFKRQL
ncbi:Fmn1p [Saccharomyces cerevisiae x Saccharomyces kudriavzevii VIN7]|uniref:Riboflavin kinase n=1 Tax=Saccharomyces cerevisiae x Saccharomyces kudriavzevii (strain VIN7) TaxID=1095631 RepID=H0GSZ2_SACCK|nr:Fmn1p [Saccharomyces cerevisiae x Saccharomyces kudriavzevii VIN7]